MATSTRFGVAPVKYHFIKHSCRPSCYIQKVTILYAELAVMAGSLEENRIINAIGPETFTFRGLIEKIGDIIGVNKPIISVLLSASLLVM
jgi:hypothetical protein